MSFRPSAVVFAVVVVVAVSIAGCREAADGLVAERLDATMTILPDGSLEVEEQWLMRAHAGAALRFRRHTPLTRHDGVIAVEGAMDGKPSPKGTAPGEITVAEGPALDAEWAFTSPEGSRHLFVLRYRLTGAVAISGIRGQVSTPLLAPSGFEIESATIALKVPPGSVLLEDPWVEEAGWDVERRADGLVATRRSIGRDEFTTPGAAFTIDTMAAEEPRWQYHARRARDLIPAFISAALFLLVIAAGAVGMIRLKYPPGRSRRAESDGQPLPGDVAQALVRGRLRRDVLPSLIAAGLVDVERMNVARDLRRTAIVTVLFGVAAWIFVSATLAHLGPWPLAIPAGILVSGLMFGVAGRRFSILSQAGVEARERMLYSARVRGGRTSA